MTFTLNSIRRASIGLAALLLLSACGQKGPLYLPENKQAEPAPKAAIKEATPVNAPAEPAL